MVTALRSAVVLLLVVVLSPSVARPAVVAALVAGVPVGLAVGAWAPGRRRATPSGGVPASSDGPSTGDVLGAANELGRVVAVHVGVVVWTVV